MDFGPTARLEQGDVAFWSYRKRMLNASGPVGTLYKASITRAGGHRNQRHSKNVCLGQARKCAQTEAVGSTYHYERRPTNAAVVAQVRELVTQGLSRRQLGHTTGVPVGTVQYYVTLAA